MDLIGYWVVITLFALPTVWVAIIIMECWISNEIKDVTGTEGTRPFNDALNKMAYNEPTQWTFMLLLLISMLCWFIGVASPDTSLVQLFNEIGTKLGPIFKYPAALFIIVCGYVFFIKKPLVKLYKLKAKLDL